MATIFIPPQIRDLTGGLDRVETSGGSVRQILEQLDKRFPGFSRRLCLDDELKPGWAASVDGQLARRGLREPVGLASEVHFLPALAGG